VRPARCAPTEALSADDTTDASCGVGLEIVAKLAIVPEVESA
jgi:hypothetical protein